MPSLPFYTPFLAISCAIWKFFFTLGILRLGLIEISKGARRLGRAPRESMTALSYCVISHSGSTAQRHFSSASMSSSAQQNLSRQSRTSCGGGPPPTRTPLVQSTPQSARRISRSLTPTAQSQSRSPRQASPPHSSQSAHGPQLASSARRSDAPTEPLPSKSARQPLHGPQLVSSARRSDAPALPLPSISHGHGMVAAVKRYAAPELAPSSASSCAPIVATPFPGGRVRENNRRGDAEKGGRAFSTGVRAPAPPNLRKRPREPLRYCPSAASQCRRRHLCPATSRSPSLMRRGLCRLHL